jgi:hypothetical protein
MHAKLGGPWRAVPVNRWWVHMFMRKFLHFWLLCGLQSAVFCSDWCQKHKTLSALHNNTKLDSKSSGGSYLAAIVRQNDWIFGPNLDELKIGPVIWWFPIHSNGIIMPNSVLKFYLVHTICIESKSYAVVHDTHCSDNS